ncbi:TlpA family protein disulfide reductase [Paucibacter sp. Y2R2-4]|uniref:TlpA family protein disulfide reductase n=1 Tax=Paucibacter sp. Y2R2-4 TaxID=2893553 RepID=UPI0021E3B6BC|nr:TlpA disulfide reductase family protein [Paucibacter sp. Y2R2-4]MCV2350932.1 TlpA family protein disulfide reductase [Paucibacter sp. Y2R2-4]
MLTLMRILRSGLRHELLGLCFLLMATSVAWASPRVGDMAPEVVGKTLEGETVSLAPYAGKVVVLSFWATWCPHCLKELPILEGIQKTGAEQVQVIAVNTEPRDVYKKVVRAMKGLSMQLAWDPGKIGAEAYGVKGIPHLVIIGRDGRVQRVFKGYGESSLDHIVAELNQAIAAPAQQELSKP